MKRSICLVGLLVIVYGLGPGVSTSLGQSYPSRPIQLIIPNVPGSIMDINARVLSDELGKLLGTQIVVVTKPGGASIFGTDFVAKSKKDGYTLGYISASGLIYTRITHPETFPYDPDKDLEPLGLHLFVPLTAAVQASSPWKTFDELIDYAKKNPGKLRVSTIGVGAIDHFNLEVMQAMTGAAIHDDSLQRRGVRHHCPVGRTRRSHLRRLWQNHPSCRFRKAEDPPGQQEDAWISQYSHGGGIGVQTGASLYLVCFLWSLRIAGGC